MKVIRSYFYLFYAVIFVRNAALCGIENRYLYLIMI
jgi:hypothetical protein